MNYYENINNIFLKFIGNNYDEEIYKKTIRKANNSLKIADSLFLKEKEKELISLITMLSTFKDFNINNSINLLFDKQNIRLFIKENKFDDIIREIIYFNEINKELIDPKEETKQYFNILKDVQILEKLYLDSINFNFIIKDNKISEHIIVDFSKNITCKNPNTELDTILINISLIFSINFKYSLYLIKQEKYIEKIISNLNLTDKVLIDLLDQLIKIVNKYIIKKIGEAYHGW